MHWPDASTPGAATLELPCQLWWSLHRGETDPILGWYSRGLGQRIPTYTLLGRGRFGSDAPLVTRLEFLDAGHTAPAAGKRSAAAAWRGSDALTEGRPGQAVTG